MNEVSVGAVFTPFTSHDDDGGRVPYTLKCMGNPTDPERVCVCGAMRRARQDEGWTMKRKVIQRQIDNGEVVNNPILLSNRESLRLMEYVGNEIFRIEEILRAPKKYRAHLKKMKALQRKLRGL